MKYHSKSFKDIPTALTFLEENTVKPISFINGPHNNIVLLYETDQKQVQDALPYNLLQRALDIFECIGPNVISGVASFKQDAIKCLQSR